MDAPSQQNEARQSLTAQMGIDAADRAARKRFVDFTDADARLLQALESLIRKHADHIVDGFYDNS